ncbi:hypothetical protein BDN72DRAFT_776898 [Pluteus cervinus]|uniref:Uncharacterized protein n=1 Tax=Pluteus cervinus TaxID=181527 RepID=A0ACD3AAF8_9AGAR|nr:hypothetical protein BDN72DRAFT_776898 [Pluteus cervinus]
MLFHLPAETIQAILSEIPDPHDLVQLACTSSIFRDLIIPRHIEYRILRLIIPQSGQFDYLWTHLLQRPNHTRNISRVEVIEQLKSSDSAQGAPELVSLFPKTLVDGELDHGQVGNPHNKDQTVLSALRLMVNLNRLTWRWAQPPTPDFLEFIFNNPSIERLYLVMKYRAPPAEFSLDVSQREGSTSYRTHILHL